MSRRLSPRRRRLVVLCAVIAASSGIMGTLLRDHPIVRVVWLVVIIAALAYAVSEIVKLNKEER